MYIVAVYVKMEKALLVDQQGNQTDGGDLE